MSKDSNGKSSKIKCADIQEVLFEYMTRELGENRSDLIREHLRKCKECQAAAADIRATLSLMKTASREDIGMPERLTDARRARMVRAFMHPVLDWIYQHHVLVSIAVAVIVISLVMSAVRGLEIWLVPDIDWDQVYPVMIGNGPPGEAGASYGTNVVGEHAMATNAAATNAGGAHAVSTNAPVSDTMEPYPADTNMAGTNVSPPAAEAKRVEPLSPPLAGD